jgi:ribonuclease P protein component
LFGGAFRTRHDRFEECGNEENLPAEPAKAGTDPRVSRAHGDPQWSQGHQVAPGQGKGAPVALTGVTPGERAADARLRRSARLTRPADFRRVFDAPTRFVDTCFAVLVRENGGRAARLGLAISKRCAPRAVDRNRLKRLVRESFRHNQVRLTGLDIVVSCRRGAAGSPSTRLVASIDKLWKSIRDQLCASC